MPRALPGLQPGWLAIDLRAEPAPGWDLGSWTGCASSTPSCCVPGSGSGITRVTANFVDLSPPSVSLGAAPAVPLGPGTWSFSADAADGTRIASVRFRIGNMLAEAKSAPYTWARARNRC